MNKEKRIQELEEHVEYNYNALKDRIYNLEKIVCKLCEHKKLKPKYIYNDITCYECIVCGKRFNTRDDDLTGKLIQTKETIYKKYGK